MSGTNEAFSRVKIDAQLKDQGWEVLNTNAVRFEYVLPDRTKADYVLCDRFGRALGVIEAKKAAINPGEAEAQAKTYAEYFAIRTNAARSIEVQQNSALSKAEGFFQSLLAQTFNTGQAIKSASEEAAVA